ncbi:MAG: nuclear transport factor 2 family protein [Vicinamibacterales bacterium]
MRTAIVLVGSFLIACSPLWAAQNQPTAAAEVERLERAWSAAFLEHDTATITRILADDYVGIDGRGVVTTKSDEIEEAKPPAANSPLESYRVLSEVLSAVRVRLFGDAAVLTAINTARISDRGEETSVRYRRTTVYVKRNGRWQCVSFHGSRIIDPAK